MRCGTIRKPRPELHSWAVTLPYIFLQLTTWSFYAVILSFSGNVLTGFGFSDSRISLFLGIAAFLSFIFQMGVGTLVEKLPGLKASGILAVLGSLMIFASVLVSWDACPKALAIPAFGLMCMIVHLLPALTNGLGMDAIKRGSPTNYSIARGMGSLGYSLFSYITGLCVRAFGARSVPVVAGISASILLLSLIWYHFVCLRELPQSTQKAVSKYANSSLLHRYPGLILMLAGVVLLQFSHGLSNTFMYQIMRAKNGTAAEQGIATAICAFVELPVMFGFPLIAQMARCDKIVRFSGFCMLLKPLLILLATSPFGVYAGQSTQILGYGLFYISSVNYVELLVRKGESLQAQNYLGAALTAGNLIALFSGGFLCQFFSVNAMIFVACTVAAIGSLIVSLSVSHQKKNTD